MYSRRLQMLELAIETARLDPNQLRRLITKTDLTLKFKQKHQQGQITLIQLMANQNLWDLVDFIAEKWPTDSIDTAKYGNVLLTAVKLGRLETVEKLLKAGAPITWSTSADSNSCLHWAVINQNPKMIKLLLKFGADPSVINNNKYTPIELAAKNIYWTGVDAFSRNKKVNQFDTGRYGSVLIDACHYNKTNSAKLLLEAGAKQTWRTNADCNYCLHWAVINQNAEMIALLLKFGGDPHTTNKAKLTPGQLANQMKLSACWETGAAMFLSNQILPEILGIFAQAQRQYMEPEHKDDPVSIPISTLPNELLEMISMHLVYKKPLQTMKDVNEDLFYASSKCFVKKYNSGFFHNRSAESSLLIKSIENILNSECPNKHKKVKAIWKEIHTFLLNKLGDLPDGHYRKSRAVELLERYKLVTNLHVEVNQNQSNEYRLARAAHG